jgi:hypothetical protein
MLLTTLKFAALVWLGVLVTATVVLAALYVFDLAALAIRRGFARGRLLAHSSTYRARLALAKMRSLTKT